VRFEEFADAYPREHGRAWYGDAARHRIVADAASWAHMWGERLHDFLSGSRGAGSFDATRELRAYSRWNQTRFVETVRAIQGLDGGGRGVRAMHFHTMAHCLLPMWRPILGAGHLANVRERRVSQMLLAVHAAHMVLKRDENLRHAASDPLLSSTLAVQHGMLTETDALITLLELTRHRQDVIVLPAPPQFESGAAEGNADLLVLDLRARTIVGVQVKTSLTRADTVRRHDRRVVLVDGVADLGNQRLVEVHPRSSTKRLTVWPGLISAHFVLRANARSTVFAPWRAAIEPLQRQLPETLHGTSDYLARAVEHVRHRISVALR
jgi:hypothetical protein